MQASTFQLFRALVPALLWLVFSTPLMAGEVTCSETSDRVLKPFIERLQAAQDGLASHAEQSQSRASKLDKLITDLQATRTNFDQKRDKDQYRYATRIAAAEQAIQDISAAHAKRISELQAAAAKAMSARNSGESDGLKKRIADENARYAAGKKSGYADELGFSNSSHNWRQFISEETAKKRKNSADHAAGLVSIYLPLLGYSLNWSGVLERIEKEQGHLADTMARNNSFYLGTLGYSLDGQGIDELLAKRQAELDDAKARIVAGTFSLYVPTFGYSLDRNGAQEKMDAARSVLADIRAGWGNGQYKTYNSAAGYTLSKGDIDKKISAAEKDLADYIAAGDDAKAYVPEIGYTTSGTDLKKRLNSAKDDKARADSQKRYAHWEKARDGVIEAKRKVIGKFEHWLEIHHELWQADIARREEKIDGYFSHALAETPCGGAGGSVAATAVTEAPALVEKEEPFTDATITPFPPQMDPEQDAAWLALKKRCTDIDTYRSHYGRGLKASIGEYMAYLRVLEKRNPKYNWRQIIARLHADFYGYDLKQTVPVIETPLFVSGADTEGYEDVDTVCKVKVGKKWKPFSPKFVYLPSGEEVDIAHLYAGPRSDMNRSDYNRYSLDMLLLANTWLGDYYQVYFDSYTKFPHNQLRGDALGIWIAQFYRLPKNKDVPFSQAMQAMLDKMGTKAGGYSRLAPPD